MQECVKTLGNEENLLPNQAVACIMQDSVGKALSRQNADVSRLHEERQQQHQNPQITEEYTAFLNGH